MQEQVQIAVYLSRHDQCRTPFPQGNNASQFRGIFKSGVLFHELELLNKGHLDRSDVAYSSRI